MTKAQVRTAILRRLRNQQEDNRRRKSAIVRRKLFRLAAFRRATTVFCYVALPYEVQTWELIEEMLAQGKRVVVPVAQRRTKSLRLCELKDPAAELSRGAFGVWEPSPRRPLPARELDLQEPVLQVGVHHLDIVGKLEKKGKFKVVNLGPSTGTEFLLFNSTLPFIVGT